MLKLNTYAYNYTMITFMISNHDFAFLLVLNIILMQTHKKKTSISLNNIEFTLDFKCWPNLFSVFLYFYQKYVQDKEMENHKINILIVFELYVSTEAKWKNIER